jgi:hypothetical protein
MHNTKNGKLDLDHASLIQANAFEIAREKYFI